MKLVAPGKKSVRLAPVRPSAAAMTWYSLQMQKLIDQMQKEILFVVSSLFGSNLAQDAEPVATLNAAMGKLGKKWIKKIEGLSSTLATSFADKTAKHTDTAFRGALKKGGWTIKPQLSVLQKEALPSIVKENVGLIKSIPKSHFEDIQRDVIDSVVKGRDMAGLTKRLQHRHGVTKRRAQLIARDQNNKATALLERALQNQLGLKKSIWVHTAGSITPREEHAEWDGLEYDNAEGMFSEVDGEFVWPGTAINCGCTSSTIIPGYDD